MLYNWLGSFWQHIYQNTELVRSFQLGQGVLSAQLYLDFLEGAGLLNRNNVPVFHRERWHYAVINKSQVGTGKAAALTVSMQPTPVLGPQIGLDFPAGAVFNLGSNAVYAQAVTYPLDIVNAADVVTCIVDNIVKPSVILTRDKDFVVENNTLFIRKDRDPFTNAAWPKLVTDTDQQITLWCCDTLVDADIIYNYIGSVLGIVTGSTEYYARFLNAVWDLYNHGTPLAFLLSAFGALFDEPTIIDAQEAVTNILIGTDKNQVITNSHVYDTTTNSVLRASVKVGAVLSQGEFLTETVRLYNTLDPMKLANANEYGTRLITDVPSLWLGPNMLQSDVRYGVGLDWTLRDIVSAGVDANGNQKLYFQMYGTVADTNLFWTDFWAYCEAHGLAPATCFQSYLYAEPTGAGVYGRTTPMEFVLRYFLKYNFSVLVIDRDALSPTVKFTEVPKFIDAYRRIIPAHVYMLIVEQVDKADDYSLDTATSELVKCWSKSKYEVVREGTPSQLLMTYTDRGVRKQWIPSCR